jgi:glycosyltransferase involved in cell wall biosynthesis
LNLVAVIPALDEEAVIGDVVRRVPACVSRIVVVDNGSRDRTAEVATAAGACVVFESRRGYGAACMAGVASAPDADAFVFLDGDGADPPEQIPALLQAMQASQVDLVLGIRRGEVEPGAMLWHQRLGNNLMSWLIRRLFAWPLHDLASYKLIRADVLHELSIEDRAQGWTAELLAKAAARNLRLVEVQTGYRRRVGVSKVSGSVQGSLRAAWQLNAAIVRVWRQAHEGRLRARLQRDIRPRAQ